MTSCHFSLPIPCRRGINAKMIPVILAYPVFLFRKTVFCDILVAVGESMSKLRGAFTAIITPFNSDFSVDYDALRSFVRFQLDEGITGLVPLGTTGETPTLLVEEEDKIIEVVFEEVRAFEKKHNKKIPIILGAGSNSTAEAVKYTERAKKAGADYALVVTPYYNKPSDEGIFRHFEAVSKVGIPIIVYNIAGRTGKNICTPLLARIAELPNIVGVKEASGDLNQMTEVIQDVVSKHPDFSVLSGDDAFIYPLAAIGGDGVISVVSNLAPREVTELTMASINNDTDKARAAHYKLLPIFKAAFFETNPCPIKFAMKHKGIIPQDTLRLPLVPILKETEPKILDAMKKSGLL